MDKEGPNDWYEGVASRREKEPETEDSVQGDSGQDGSSRRDGLARDMLRAGEQRAAGLRAASETAEGAGAALGKGSKLISKGGKIKMAVAAAPLVAIFIGIILLVVALTFGFQALFVEGIRAELDNHWNSTETAASTMTDNFTDTVQLGGGGGGTDTVFDSMSFSEEEAESLKEQGFELRQFGGGTALTYNNPTGGTDVIVGSSNLSRTTNGEMVAEGEAAVTDSGVELISEQEAKQAILDELGIVAATTENVKSFPDAMANDADFRRKFKAAAEYWRGGISGWYNDMTELVRARLGISRNNFKDWENDTDEEANQKKLIEFAATKPAANEESPASGQSLMEQVKEVAAQSSNPNCGTSSGFNSVESVVAADQTARQVSAASLFLESIDKTRAGEWENAPMNSMLNIFFNSGGAQTESIYSLFSHTTVNQANELVQKASAQAHGNSESILSQTNGEEYRSCAYVGNTNQMDNGGAVVEVGSVFKPLQWIAQAIASIANRILSFFGISTGDAGGATGDTAMAEAALGETVSQYEDMTKQKYITGDDTGVLGEGIISGAERIYNEKAKSDGQAIGNENALLATYRKQQEIIAEQAEYDQATKSPFDVSSPYTFLGSIAQSLIPFATSSGAINLKTTLTSIGGVVSGALTNLLPTSQAAGELNISRGDCVFSNNIGGISNPHCNNYYNSDLEMVGSKQPKEIYETVRNSLRYDTAGYVYGTDINATVKSQNDFSKVKVLVWALGTNNRGVGNHGGGAEVLTQKDIDDLAAAVSDDTIVYLVSNVDVQYTPTEHMYDRNNQLLEQAVRDHANWRLIDWRNTVNYDEIIPNDPQDWFVHPNAAGAEKWVNLLAQAVELTGYSGEAVAIIGDSLTELNSAALAARLPGAHITGRLGRTWQQALDEEKNLLKQTQLEPTKIGVGTRENTEVADWGDGPLNIEENTLPYHWSNIVDPILNYPHLIIHGSKTVPNGCESDWYHYEVPVYDGNGNLLYIEWHYYFDEPNEWSYSRSTNFQYNGYQSGWHNRLADGTVGVERAKNKNDPGMCELDLAKNADKQPLINPNSALGMYVLVAGQRTAEWGVTDDFALNLILKSDFTKGRLHPCFVGSDECSRGIYLQLCWTDDPLCRSGGGGTLPTRTPGQISEQFKKNTANSAAMSRWIGGSAYVYYEGQGLDSFGSMNTGFNSDERFKDPTRGNNYFWQENKWYQEYVQTLSWMESTGLIARSEATVAVQKYYDENPLDQSYEGVIARYSGMSRDEVVAVVDLLQYVAYLQEYSTRVAGLGPLSPVEAERLDYSGDAVVIIAEQIIQTNGVVYDELRNKTVAA